MRKRESGGAGSFAMALDAAPAALEAAVFARCAAPDTLPTVALRARMPSVRVISDRVSGSTSPAAASILGTLSCQESRMSAKRVASVALITWKSASMKRSRSSGDTWATQFASVEST